MVGSDYIAPCLHPEVAGHAVRCGVRSRNDRYTSTTREGIALVLGVLDECELLTLILARKKTTRRYEVEHCYF